MFLGRLELRSPLGPGPRNLHIAFPKHYILPSSSSAYLVEALTVFPFKCTPSRPPRATQVFYCVDDLPRRETQESHQEEKQGDGDDKQSKNRKELVIYAEDSTIVNIVDDNGQSALFLASENGHLEVVRLLIQSGSTVYRTDRQRNMAIHLAAEKGHLEIVRLLLGELPNQVDSALQKWEDALAAWVREEDCCSQEFIEALVETQAVVGESKALSLSPDPSKRATPEEREKLRRGVVSSLRTFDKEAYSPSGTALFRAVRRGHLDVAKLLLDEVPEMPLQACQLGSLNVLSLAARQGCTAIMRLLIASNAKINYFTDLQTSYLHEATIRPERDSRAPLTERRRS